MSTPTNKPPTRRRPNAAAALKALEAAGLKPRLKDMKVGQDEITFTFSDGSELSGNNDTSWDAGFERYKELRRGKHKI